MGFELRTSGVGGNRFFNLATITASVTRLGDLLDFGPFFKAFGNN